MSPCGVQGQSPCPSETNMRIIITGGSRGIGAACVRAFAGRGDSVAFIYRSSDDRAAEVAAETGAFPVRGDVADPESARCAAGECVRRLGGVDVLVNCAGVAEFSLFQDITEDMWHRMIETDLGGTYRVTREVLPQMISQKFGRIVNIASMWGETGASCETHYSAAKAGVIGLTKALAKEIAPSGITVNCVSPGAIDTEMNASLSPEAIDAIAEDTPVGRIGKADEVAEAVLFFASDKAGFVTGQVLGVNGGYVI